MNLEDVQRLVAARTHAASGSGRIIRKAAGLSIGEVAKHVGVSTPTIWKWEEGIHSPRGDAGRRWADLLAELTGRKVSRAR